MIKKIYQFFQSIVVLLMWPTLLLACLELMIHVFTVLVLDGTFSLGLTSPFKNFFVGTWLVQAFITIEIDIYASSSHSLLDLISPFNLS